MIGQRMRGTLMPTDIAFDGVSETKAHSAAKITSTERKGHGIAPGAPELEPIWLLNNCPLCLTVEFNLDVTMFFTTTHNRTWFVAQSIFKTNIKYNEIS